MTFDYTMKADGSQAVAESRKVEDSLVKVEKAAGSAGKAITHGFANSALRDSAGRFIATASAADNLRSRAPLLVAAYDAYQNKMREAARRTEEQSKAMQRLTEIHNRNAAANQPLVRSFGSLSEAIRRETEMLERIHGPAKQHAQDVETLNSLYKRGRVSADEYAGALEKISARGGGPKRAPSTGFDRGEAANLLRSQGGGLGGIAGDALEGGTGVLLKAGAIGAGLAMLKQTLTAIVELGDAYTVLERKANKVAGAFQNTAQVLSSHVRASGALNSSLSETLELSDKVKEATDDMNLTSKQQLDLTRSLGAAVKLSGSDLGEAGGLIDKLSFSLQNGVVTGGEFRSMVKAFPDLMQVMQESTGKSRDELFRMARAGELSADVMIDALQRQGDALENKLGARLETTGEKMQKFKDRASVAWGGLAQTMSTSLGAIIDAAADVIDPFEDMREAMEAATRAATFEAEIDAKMIANKEKLIQTERVLAAARSAGMSVGVLDVESVASADRLRAVMAELGVVMPQVLVESRAKATQLENKFNDLVDQRAGEKLAADARKAWKVYADINDVIDDHAKKLTTAVDKVDEYRKAVEKLESFRKGNAVSPAGGMLPGLGGGGGSMFQAQGGGATMTAQERDARRGLVDATAELDVVTGRLSQTSADAAKKIRDHKNSLSDLNDDYKRGAINAREYAEGLKMLGVEKSRMQKLLEDIRGPEIEFNKNVAALNALLNLGRISIVEYNRELVKLIEAFRGKDSSDWRLLDVVNAPWDAAQARVRAMIGEIQAMNQAARESAEIFKEIGFKQLEQPGRAASILSGPGGVVSGLDMDAVNAREKAFAAQNRAGIESQMAGTGPRNDVAFKATTIEEATLYTKAWNRELERNKKAWADVDQFGQATIGHVRDAIVDMVLTGKGSFGDLVKSIERDLVRLATNRLLMSLLGSAFGGGGAASVFGTGATQSFSGLFTDGGGHSSGGSYVVGGAGGPDSQNVVFRLTPGERVDFTPPGEPRGGPGGSVEVHNHYDEGALLSPIQAQSYQARRAVHNMIRRNPRGFGRR